MSPIGPDAFDAVVVGAGPAGSAASTLLARGGRRVLLLEKDSFPRPKVCGEFLSSDALPTLEKLGVRAAVERAGPERIDRGSIHWPGGRSVSFRLPAPAYGVSRLLLDDLLARGASEAGADTRFAARVTSVEGASPGGFQVRFSHARTEQEVRTRFVVGAWGRWDALDRKLDRGFQLARSRYLGWSRDYEGDTARLAGQVRLYVFAGGYCGLSRVEGERVNLAGIIAESVLRRRRAGWEAVLARAKGSNPALAADLAALTPGPTGFLGTGPVFLTAKPPSEEGILMAGDAAGVIDPFSGEGQAAALASGVLAGETIERALAGDLSPDQTAALYTRAWKDSNARRFTWSSLLRRFILHPRLGAAAAGLAGEKLVGFAMGVLKRKELKIED
jgi:flavin-dependent dehydrogenase